MNTNPSSEGRVALARFAWVVVVVSLAVVLWGALVRATGSGAGCGSHWPLCNGEIVPTAPAVATLIEFTHRGLSGAALILVAALWLSARRRFPPGHSVRWWSAAALALIVIEALIGAGLVLMGWVADDASLGRAVSIPLHLGVTFSLLGALTMTAWRAGDRRPPGSIGSRSGPGWLEAALLAGMVAVGMTGALTALGDTLFPSESLVDGVLQDFAESSALMVRLRVIHPVLAVIVGAIVFRWAGARLPTAGEGSPRRRLIGLRWLILGQFAVGVVNVLLLAPVWLQLVHLLVADAAWIVLVISVAEAAEGSPTGAPQAPPSASKISK